jgi:hypothetical protein
VHPERFSVEPGAAVKVRLAVGHGDDVKTVARKPDRIERFESVGAEAARPLTGAPGDDPAGKLDTDGLAGAQLLVYASNHAYIELEPPAFERYLAHEGLARIVNARAERGETKKPGRESYARSSKALLTVGAPGEGFDRVLGLPIELVPVDDPRRPKAPLRFRLLFEGAPLAGARVDLMPLDDLHDVTAANTDAKGEVRFAAPEPGSYLVAATHMVRAEPPVRGDWRSEWATFTFERAR